MTQLNVNDTVWLSSMSIIQHDSAQCQWYNVTQLNVNYLFKMIFNRPPGPICFNVPGH